LLEAVSSFEVAQHDKALLVRLMLLLSPPDTPLFYVSIFACFFTFQFNVLLLLTPKTLNTLCPIPQHDDSTAATNHHDRSAQGRR
jgi:hypothetical protein